MFVVSKSSEYDHIENKLKAVEKVIGDRPDHFLFDEWYNSKLHVQIPTSAVFAKVDVKISSEDEFFGSFEFLEGNQSLVLVLDHLQDPRNFGAIARSAAFLGVKTIIFPKARQVSLSMASVATSQGAFAYLNLVQVANLSRVIKKLKEADYWVLGADMEGESVESVRGFYQKSVLILGNEGKGLSRLIKEQCDRIVSIPGEAGGLESLNVSVAAGLLIYRLRQESEK